MGQWVILIGNTEFGPDSIREFAFANRTDVQDYGEKQLDILFNDGYVSFQFDYDGTIMSGYSPEELRNLPYHKPQFILMKYSEKRLLEKIISSKDFPKDVFIDCDGVDLGLEQFIDRSRLLNCSENREQ